MLIENKNLGIDFIKSIPFFYLVNNSQLLLKFFEKMIENERKEAKK